MLKDSALNSAFNLAYVISTNSLQVIIEPGMYHYLVLSNPLLLFYTKV